MALARIGLGSNLGDARANVERALDALDSLGTVRARSSLYRTKAWGVTDQPDFINAAALLETSLEPRALLGALENIETRLGRVATFRWGPRAIDLDILAYDDRRIDEPDLVIPHRHLCERAFALVPLAEIDAAFGSALHALSAADRTAVQRIPVRTERNGGAVNWEETLARVRRAAEFCTTAGLTRFRVEDDDVAIEVQRSAVTTRVRAAAAPEPAVAQNGRTAGSTSHVEPPHHLLRAEFVGIVRLSRPAVGPGTVLGADRELAYVEALGIRNPVRSGGPGRVADVLVSDGDAVDFGQALFALES